MYHLSFSLRMLHVTLMYCDRVSSVSQPLKIEEKVVLYRKLSLSELNQSINQSINQSVNCFHSGI